MSQDVRDQPPATTGRRRVWLVIALAAVGGVAAGWLLTRAPGPPGAPASVTAEPFRCAGSCRRLDASITLRWSAPSGGTEPTGYRIERDGVALADGGQAATETRTYIDRGVTFGQRYDYQVIALSSSGHSPSSAVVSTRLPAPPTTSAQLTGVYAVHLEVRDAQALSSALGIEDPAPGGTATDRWTFAPLCTTPRSACPVRWEGLEGLLVAHGTSWSGTVAGPEARCGGGTNVAAPTRFDLDVTEAAGDEDAWVVRSFEGSVSISFHCPGFLASSGTIAVRGTRR